jgi:hypothetical protein
MVAREGAAVEWEGKQRVQTGSQWEEQTAWASGFLSNLRIRPIVSYS